MIAAGIYIDESDIIEDKEDKDDESEFEMDVKLTFLKDGFWKSQYKRRAKHACIGGRQGGNIKEGDPQTWIDAFAVVQAWRHGWDCVG